MDPKSPYRYVLPPSAAAGTTAMDAPGDLDQGWRVDDHLVRPEHRDEVVNGRHVQALPANLPHGHRHCELDYVIRGNVADGYVGATDLLTRVSGQSNFATDTCLVREGIDPRTGRRYLEELAFEVVAEQSVADVTERARQLSARGIRRLIAIFVNRGQVCEWSSARDDWAPLKLDDEVVDPTLRHPMKVRALLDAAEADDAVARALRAKGNPVIAEVHDEGHQQGLDSLRRSIQRMCDHLDISVGEAERAQLSALDGPGLESLHDHLLIERRWS